MAHTLPYMPFDVSILLHSRVLLHCLCGDSGGRFGGVILLNVGRGRTDSPPSFAGRKPHASDEANQHQKSANKLSHLSSRIWLVTL